MDEVYIAPPHSYARPLKRGLEAVGFKVEIQPPPEAYASIIRGRADAALVPLALAAGRRICRGPMVYTSGETMSVAIFSPKQVGLEGCRAIAVTRESRTSILYLKAALTRLGYRAKILQGGRRAEDLLGLSDCIMLLGDEALRARTRLHVVEDLGALVKSTLGIDPVYAATIAPGACPERLSKYKPLPSSDDPLETSRATGIGIEEARRYHEIIKLDYNPAALERALHLILRIKKEGHIQW